MITEREIEVLKLKKQGLTQVEIAKKLKVSPAAVSGFYSAVLKKINDSKETLKIAREFKLE
jgi:transcriptional regulator